MGRRARWPTVLFGALPASYLAFPAALGILFGSFFSLALEPVGLLMLVSGSLGWIGTVSLWAAARSPGTIGRRTAWGLALGTGGGLIFALIKLFHADLSHRLGWFPVVLIVGPIWVAVVHLWRFKKAAASGSPESRERATIGPRSGFRTRPRRMRLVLEAILLVELVASCLFVPMLFDDQAGWGLFFLLVFTFPFLLAFLLTSAWSFWQHPSLRTLSAAVFLAPIVVTILLKTSKALLGPEITSRYSLVAAAALPFVAVLLLPRRVGQFLPRFVVHSRLLNLAVLALLVVMILPWPVLLLWLRPWEHGESANWFLYIVWHTGASIIAGVVVFLLGYTVMFLESGREQIKLRVAQMALSVVLLALAIPTAGVLYIIVGAASVG